ncbi:hypothetical protein [Nocardia transvalensis]|uniref:hypothetical protein n=1 Tax=Nocardia transvalensis TaxID=37333 RepID=UPI001892DAAC|nr:hypothetical protein [Nocardia transvalensis]MBF6331592.1 hypothetical protein [Nocardia transvalensis]
MVNNRSPLFAGTTAAVSLAVGIVALVVADGLLDDRKQQLLDSRCKRTVEVPAAATVLDYTGAALLIVSTLSLAVLAIMLISRPGRLKAVWITIAGIACLGVGLYAALVTVGTVAPGSYEPNSPQYDPCPSRI